MSEWDGRERRDEPATTGAQRQIDDIRAHATATEARVKLAIRALRIGSGLFLAAIVVAVIALGNVATDASNAVETAEAERDQRSASVSGVISLFCDINNEQDRLLADLVAASIGSGEDSSFGAGLDPATLTEFDLAVLASIAKVQMQTADTNGTLPAVFQKKLKQLQDLTPCATIVSLYLAGEEVPQLKDLNTEAKKP